MNEFGLKELYDVIIRTTSTINIDGYIVEMGEAIAAFDKIQIANVKEIRDQVSAHGDWDNRGLVFWDTTKEIQIQFSQGIFSKRQLALMSNNHLISQSTNDTFLLNKREIVESDENGYIHLSQPFSGTTVFVYEEDTGIKLKGLTAIDNQTIDIKAQFKNVLVDYNYEYTNKTSTMIIGTRLTNGFFTLTGKTKFKDDITGQVHTGVLMIPRLKLTSSLSMRLGQNAQPVVGTLAAVAVPIGDRNNTEVMKLVFLDDDVDSDM